MKKIDQSPLLSRLIEKAGLLLAKQRGLPVVVGLIFVVIGFVFQFVDVYSTSQLVEVLGIVFHNVGILIALIGLLLADPLGK